MTPRFDLSTPVDSATDRSPPGPVGTWTIDHTRSSVALTWRRLGLGTVTGRLHGLGIVHVDDLPPADVIRFQQPSGLPVLTMALDPASLDTGDARLDTRLCGPDTFDVTRHRWWTLRSESLEVLPTGTWRVMATLTARGTSGLVELRFEVDAGDPDWLALRGRGVLHRPALGSGKPPWARDPRVRVDLDLQARRVVTPAHTEWRHQERATRSEAAASRRLASASRRSSLGRRATA
jgi:polyisoprenoid-binding protein YceI